MPDHKVKIAISRERRPWWRTWNDYPNPTRDALLAALVSVRGEITMSDITEEMSAAAPSVDEKLIGIGRL
jgi:hypothetical protein